MGESLAGLAGALGGGVRSMEADLLLRTHVLIAVVILSNIYITKITMATHNTMRNLRKWCSAESMWWGEGCSLSTSCSSSTVLN